MKNKNQDTQCTSCAHGSIINEIERHRSTCQFSKTNRRNYQYLQNPEIFQYLSELRTRHMIIRVEKQIFEIGPPTYMAGQ